jgi:amidase
MTLPPWALGAAELAAKIRDGDLSSEDVVRAHLDRIEVVNPSVNALTVIMREGAIRSAKAADRAIETGEVVGPLHGVPFTVKETIDVAGTATTHGIVDMRGSLPESDAPVVALLKSAGAIPIGRTNTPDFGVRYHTDNDLWGATVNPWDPVRTPGGSSGGEAAAISTGMSPLGVGSDVGGSLRYPAQCCGVAAIRPSFGRTSRIQTTLFGDTPMLYEQIACVPGPRPGESRTCGWPSM